MSIYQLVTHLGTFGIDFGGNSVVLALNDGKNNPVIIKNENNDSVHSCSSFINELKEYLGCYLPDNHHIDIEIWKYKPIQIQINNYTLYFNTNAPYLVDNVEKGYLPIDLLFLLLMKYLHADYMSDSNDVIFSYPLYYTESQTEYIKQLYTLIGYNVIEILPEYMSIATYYGFANDLFEEDCTIVVIDIGYICSSSTVMKYKDNECQILSYIYNRGLGVRIIEQYMLEIIIEKLGLNIEDINDRLYMKIKNEVKRVRELLYKGVERVDIVIDYGEDDYITEFTLNELNEVFEKNEIVDSVLNLISESITESKINLRDKRTAEVYLIGGGSSISLINDRIQEYMKNDMKNNKTVNYESRSESVISLGNSYYKNVMKSKSKYAVTDESIVIISKSEDITEDEISEEYYSNRLEKMKMLLDMIENYSESDIEFNNKQYAIEKEIDKFKTDIENEPDSVEKQDCLEYIESLQNKLVSEDIANNKVIDDLNNIEEEFQEEKNKYYNLIANKSIPSPRFDEDKSNDEEEEEEEEEELYQSQANTKRTKTRNALAVSQKKKSLFKTPINREESNQSDADPDHKELLMRFTNYVDQYPHYPLLSIIKKCINQLSEGSISDSEYKKYLNRAKKYEEYINKYCNERDQKIAKIKSLLMSFDLHSLEIEQNSELTEEMNELVNDNSTKHPLSDYDRIIDEANKLVISITIKEKKNKRKENDEPVLALDNTHIDDEGNEMENEKAEEPEYLPTEEEKKYHTIIKFNLYFYSFIIIIRSYILSMFDVDDHLERKLVNYNPQIIKQISKLTIEKQDKEKLENMWNETTEVVIKIMNCETSYYEQHSRKVLESKIPIALLYINNMLNTYISLLPKLIIDEALIDRITGRIIENKNCSLLTLPKLKSLYRSVLGLMSQLLNLLNNLSNLTETPKFDKKENKQKILESNKPHIPTVRPTKTINDPTDSSLKKFELIKHIKEILEVLWNIHDHDIGMYNKLRISPLLINTRTKDLIKGNNLNTKTIEELQERYKLLQNINQQIKRLSAPISHVVPSKQIKSIGKDTTKANPLNPKQILQARKRTAPAAMISRIPAPLSSPRSDVSLTPPQRFTKTFAVKTETVQLPKEPINLNNATTNNNRNNVNNNKEEIENEKDLLIRVIQQKLADLKLSLDKTPRLYKDLSIPSDLLNSKTKTLIEGKNLQHKSLKYLQEKQKDVDYVISQLRITEAVSKQSSLDKQKKVIVAKRKNTAPPKLR